MRGEKIIKHEVSFNLHEVKLNTDLEHSKTQKTDIFGSIGGEKDNFSYV